MTRVPPAALVIGWLGFLPFFYGAMLVLVPAGTLPTFGIVSSDADGGLRLLARFGVAILGFMGGCLWGFASAGARVPTPMLLILSGVPALLAVLAVQPDPARSCIWLAFGFAVLQAIDVVFQRLGVAPAYWLSLRLPLTAGVMSCLLIGAIHG